VLYLKVIFRLVYRQAYNPQSGDHWSLV